MSGEGVDQGAVDVVDGDAERHRENVLDHGCAQRVPAHGGPAWGVPLTPQPIHGPHNTPKLCQKKSAVVIEEVNIQFWHTANVKVFQLIQKIYIYIYLRATNGKGSYMYEEVWSIVKLQ